MRNGNLSQISMKPRVVCPSILKSGFATPPSVPYLEISKRCSKCKQSKPASEFFKDRIKKDGLCSYCKTCQRKCQNSEKGKIARRIKERRYRQTEKGKAVQSKKYEKYRNSTKGKASQKARIKQFYTRNPNYPKAVNAVNHAIRAGRLPRPDTLLCHYCPKPAKQYHHWHGYEKEYWLDVVPTCIDCHKNSEVELKVLLKPRFGFI